MSDITKYPTEGMLIVPTEDGVNVELLGDPSIRLILDQRQAMGLAQAISNATKPDYPPRETI